MVTSKMEARAQYEKELKELGDEEESDLEVFDDRAGGATPEVEKQEPVTSSGKSKGKAKASEPVGVGSSVATSTVGKKRRRPAVDPFAGE